MRARLLIVAGALAASAAVVGGSRVTLACDINTCPPMLTGVAPMQLVVNGKPLHLTLTGAALTNVSGVVFSPVVPGDSFSVFNDSTILVTLPAGTTPAVYSVRVVAPQGGSDPGNAPQFEVFPAPPPPPPPTSAAKPTATPEPTATPTPPAPETGVLLVTSAAVHTSGPRPPAVLTGGGQVAPASAPVDVMFGLALGGILYLLWGSPRRLSGSWRSNPVGHLVGRPLQALHMGRICLYCGHLHFIWNTRRDLWTEGRYCGPECFISAEALPSPLADENEPAPVVEQKNAAWWRAAVATDQGPVDISGGADAGDGVWRPRF